MSIIKIIVYDFGESNRRVDGARHMIKMTYNVMCEVYKFKNLGSVVQRNGGFEEDVGSI